MQVSQAHHDSPDGLGDHYLVIRQFDGQKFNPPRYVRTNAEEFQAACRDLLGVDRPTTLCMPHKLVHLVKGTDGRLAVLAESHPDADILTLFRIADLAAQLECTVVALVPGAEHVIPAPEAAPLLGAN